MKKVLFVHYRTGERDGVGLEIEKRVNVVKELGGQAFYLSGFDAWNRKEAYIVPHIDMKNPSINAFRLQLFHEPRDSEEAIISQYKELEAAIEKDVKNILNELQPDLVYVTPRPVLFSIAI